MAKFEIQIAKEKGLAEEMAKRLEGVVFIIKQRGLMHPLKRRKG